MSSVLQRAIQSSYLHLRLVLISLTLFGVNACGEECLCRVFWGLRVEVLPGASVGAVTVESEQERLLLVELDPLAPLENHEVTIRVTPEYAMDTVWLRSATIAWMSPSFVDGDVQLHYQIDDGPALPFEQFLESNVTQAEPLRLILRFPQKLISAPAVDLRLDYVASGEKSMFFKFRMKEPESPFRESLSF